ncbi:PQQ-binding-like beta-propeller repeat protein [Gemmatimonadota bacterium]
MDVRGDEGSFLLVLPFLLLIGCDGNGGTGPDPDPTPKYNLVVEKSDGLLGFPESQQTAYNSVQTVDYLYSLMDGSSELLITLDGSAVPDSGRFVMNRDHRLVAGCEKRAFWSVGVPDEIYYPSPAVADDGTIYFGTGAYSITNHGSLFATSPAGAILWSRDLGGNVFSPAIGQDGTVLVQDSDNAVYAFSPAGDLLWTFEDFEYPDHPRYPVGQRVPAIASDGTVYIVADGLYALDPATGQRLWRFNPFFGKSCRQPPVIGEDGTIYLTIHQHDFFAVNPDGTEKWHTQFDNDFEMSFTSPAIDSDGSIYLGVEGAASHVWAFNSDGSVKWKHDIEGDYCSVRGSPTIASDGTVYVSTKACPAEHGKVIALDPSSGRRVWTYVVLPEHGTAALDDVYSTPTVGADGLIYFGSETERFYALNPDGTLNWKTRLGGINWSSAAILFDGTLYIGTHNNNPGMHGYLWALSTSSQGSAASPWPRFRHDNKNTGRAGAG